MAVDPLKFSPRFRENYRLHIRPLLTPEPQIPQIRKLASLTFASTSSQLSPDEGEETMVRAWYFDCLPGDQREPHRGEDVSLEELVKIGVLYWKVATPLCGHVHACWLRCRPINALSGVVPRRKAPSAME